MKAFDASLDDSERSGVAARLLEGAIAGAIGVWAMDRVDWFNWNREGPLVRERTRRVRPGGEAPAGVAAGKAEDALGIEPSPAQHRAAESVIHYALGIGPAALYGVLRGRVPAIGTGRGTLYGLALFAAQDELLNTVAGLAAAPQDYPWQDHARGVVAHLVYGIVTDSVLRSLRGRGR